MNVAKDDTMQYASDLLEISQRENESLKLRLRHVLSENRELQLLNADYAHKIHDLIAVCEMILESGTIHCAYEWEDLHSAIRNAVARARVK